MVCGIFNVRYAFGRMATTWAVLAIDNTDIRGIIDVTCKSLLKMRYMIDTRQGAYRYGAAVVLDDIYCSPDI